MFLAKFGCWAPPTFSTRGCLWKSSMLAISTRFLDFSNTDFSNMPCFSNPSTQMGLNLERYPCWLTIAAKTSTSKSSKSKRLPVNVGPLRHWKPARYKHRALFWKAYHWRLHWEQRHVSKSYVYYDVYIYTHNQYVYIKILQCTYNIVPRCGSQVVDVPACTMATVPQSPWSWHTANNHMAARCSNIFLKNQLQFDGLRVVCWSSIAKTIL